MMLLYVLVLTAVFIQKGDATCYSPVSITDTQLCNTCSGGFCTIDNGCSCNSDSTITCAPTTECDTVASNICCPIGYYWSATEHCCTDILTCNPACQSDQICQNISKTATCGCNTTLYSGQNTDTGMLGRICAMDTIVQGAYTSSLVPTVKCESNIILVSLNKCFLEALGFDSSTFQLNNNSDSCTNSYTETVNSTTMQIIQALPQTGWCGNEVITDSLKVYYSNALHIGIQNRSIITVNPLNINFSCSYNLTMQTSLVGAFKPVVNSVNLTINGEGSALTTMSAYWDQAYTKQIQENEDVPIGSNVYLDIVSDAGDVDSFVLRVDSCYATPDNNVNNVNKVAIVSSGCPANQGVTAEVQENGVSLESRIKFNSFAFQGQPLVYITCIVRLCGKNTTCTGCNAARSTDGQAQLQIPINFIDDYSSSASNTAVSWVAMTSSLLVFLTVKLF